MSDLYNSHQGTVIEGDLIKAEGDLTKAGETMETSCNYGQPIEEVYDGVLDGPILGSGAWGTVRVITHKRTNVQYALKILKLDHILDSNDGPSQQQQQQQQLLDELAVLCQIDHPNIARVEEVYEGIHEICIVQQLCQGGTLFDRLLGSNVHASYWTEQQCARLVKQMLSAIFYLHSRGIIHGDLKLESFVFFTSDLESELCLIDFGWSKHFHTPEGQQPQQQQLVNERVLRPYTLAPEMMEGQFDEKSDIWSLGVITYLLLSGETPFGGLDGEHFLLIKRRIPRARPLFEPVKVWERVSNDAVAFLRRLLQVNPILRPTSKEAQKDNWMQTLGATNSTQTGNRANNLNTRDALIRFKEQADLQKLLSESLGFALFPEQIIELHTAFQRVDVPMTGEISLGSLKMILLESAEAGKLGQWTKVDIESLFDSTRPMLRRENPKDDPMIYWDELLICSLSHAQMVDDHNLRLAFNRMDSKSQGYITLQNFQDLLLLGPSTGAAEDHSTLETLWLGRLNEVHAFQKNRIYYEDFQRIMNGSPDHKRTESFMDFSMEFPLQDDTSSSLSVTQRSALTTSGLVMDQPIPSHKADPSMKAISQKLPPRIATPREAAGESEFFWEDPNKLGDDKLVETIATPSPRRPYRPTGSQFSREVRQALLEATKLLDPSNAKGDATDRPVTTSSSKASDPAGLVIKRSVHQPQMPPSRAANEKMMMIISDPLCCFEIEVWQPNLKDPTVESANVFKIHEEFHYCAGLLHSSC